MESRTQLAILVFLLAFFAATESARLFGGRKCKPHELKCWSFFKYECFNPGAGEICRKGRLDCGSGFRRCGQKTCIRAGECCGNERRCGQTCYNPFEGETCTSSGNICRFGNESCGKFCFNRQTQVCWPGNLICNLGEQPCFGVSCYRPSSGQTCFNGGLVCNYGQIPGPFNTCQSIR